MVRDIEGQTEPASPETSPFTEADEKVIEQLKARFSKADKSPKDLGFASAYLFGAVCPSEGKAAALIMPICNIAAMNHHLSEISSQVAADAHAVVILDRAGLHRSRGPRLSAPNATPGRRPKVGDETKMI
jgi:N-acetylglucosamine kinase-like BadF-type ATPase